MVYSKMSVDAAFDANPDVSVLTGADLAIEDHIRANGCSFERGAAERAIQATELDLNAKASDLTEDDRERLAQALEDLEIYCPHKTPKGGEEVGGSPGDEDSDRIKL